MPMKNNISNKRDEQSQYKKALKLLGLRVQFFRQQKDITQEYLAEKIDKTVDTVSNIERGVGFARIDTLIDICNVLSIELADLFAFPVDSHTNKKRARSIKYIATLLSKENDVTSEKILKILEEILELKEEK